MERLIVVHWNKSTGPIPIIQYPPEGAYPSKDIFLKIWAQHDLNKENSLIELEEKDRHIISIIQEYEGEVYFLCLFFMTKNKVSEIISSDILAIITKNLLELINTNKITRAISEAFNTIKGFSKKHLLAIVVLGVIVMYTFIIIQRSMIQRNMVDVINGYTQQQPADMCVNEVTVDHNIFPPRYGTAVTYVPCPRSMHMQEQ